MRGGGVGGFGEGDGDGRGEGWNPDPSAALRDDNTLRDDTSQMAGPAKMPGTRMWVRMTIVIFVGEAEDFEGGQAELAAGGDGEGLEEVEVFEGVVGVERDEFGPAIAIGRRTGAVTTRKFFPASLVRM
jgi:hypothetical protein